MSSFTSCCSDCIQLPNHFIIHCLSLQSPKIFYAVSIMKVTESAGKNEICNAMGLVVECGNIGNEWVS